VRDTRFSLGIVNNSLWACRKRCQERSRHLGLLGGSQGLWLRFSSIFNNDGWERKVSLPQHIIAACIRRSVLCPPEGAPLRFKHPIGRIILLLLVVAPRKWSSNQMLRSSRSHSPVLLACSDNPPPRVLKSSLCV
jgi:hypothetical protein